MAAIHIPRRHLIQPQGRIALDQEARLSSLFMPSAGPVDPVTGSALTMGGGSLLLAAFPNGIGARLQKSLNQYINGLLLGADFSRYSIVAHVFSTGTDASYSNVLNLAATGGQLGAVQLRHTTANWDFYHQAAPFGSWKLAQGVGLYKERVPQTLVCTYDGSAITLYIDGAQVAQTAASGYGAGTPNFAVLGCDYTNYAPVSGSYFDGGLLLVGVAAGVSWDTEFASRLGGNPWQLFRADPIRFYSLPSGGTSQDLAASGAATASGTATAAAQFALAGVGVSLASGSATLAASGPLAASGGSTASGTAAQTISIAMSALGLTVASGTAALSSSTSGSLAASGGATAGGSAAAVANVSISAAGLAQAAAQAGLAASVLLAGAGAAAASGNAALAVQLQALAQGAAQVSGSATLQGSTAGQLSAGGQATAAGSAALVLDVRLQAAGGAQAGGSGALSAGDAATISGSGGATSGGSGALSALVTLTGAGFVQAMGAGYLVVQVPLSATGGAIAAGGASLSELPDVLPRVASPYRTWRVRAHNRTLRIRA